MDINKIKLSVPVDRHSDAGYFLSDDNIGNIYVEIPGNFLESTGAKDSINRYVNAAHHRGISFTFLMDATCWNNLEWTRGGQRQIRAFLDNLVSWGVDAVSVSMPYFVELIKKQYPKINVEISSNAEVDNIQRAKRWEDSGADIITLASYKVNRNFALLEGVRSNVKCGLQLVANHCCLNNCVNHGFHSNLAAHLTGQSFAVDNAGIFYGIKCLEERSRTGFDIISSQWIRPEDIKYYEGIGINRLQLLGDSLNSGDSVEIINAYSKRCYAGNLIKLFPDFPRCALHHEGGASPGVFINNSDLDGFMEHFLEGKCRGLCGECRYCEDIAGKVIHFAGARNG
ncbi:MAG: U32 family peptidase [Candidatus Omnitrophica bacterium]|nr:U32 family peptidase [Candidatus Omnitrophota bacterium]